MSVPVPPKFRYRIYAINAVTCRINFRWKYKLKIQFLISLLGHWEQNRVMMMATRKIQRQIVYLALSTLVFHCHLMPLSDWLIDTRNNVSTAHAVIARQAQNWALIIVIYKFRFLFFGDHLSLLQELWSLGYLPISLLAGLYARHVVSSAYDAFTHTLGWDELIWARDNCC